MTVDLLDQEPPDAEDFVVSWLQPLLRAGTEIKTDDGFPFAIVQYIDGTDTVDEGTEDGVLQVDFLDRARDGMVAVQAAKSTAREGHRRMMYLAKHVPNVELSDGSTASCDYLTTLSKPKRMPYTNEKVVRYTARYSLGLSYVAV